MLFKRKYFLINLKHEFANTYRLVYFISNINLLLYPYMIEHFFQCPYCWEEISMLLEKSDQIQNYIEDCEVCCQPIQIEYQLKDELKSFKVI